MVQRDKWSVSVLQRKFNFVYKLYQHRDASNIPLKNEFVSIKNWLWALPLAGPGVIVYGPHIESWIFRNLGDPLQFASTLNLGNSAASNSSSIKLETE